MMIRSSDAGMDGFRLRKDFGRSLTWAYITDTKSPLSDENGKIPQANSYKRTPTEYRSLARSPDLPKKRSGGRYAIVPTISPLSVKFEISLIRRAKPKSITLITFSSLNIKFPG